MMVNITQYKLNEGVSSPVIYHYSRTQSVLKILHENTFALTAGFAIPADNHFNRGRMYYMSCGTNKNPSVAYGYNRNSEGWVRITLDGTKLAQRYKFVPVEYWERNDSVVRWTHKGMDEQEDRLVSNRDTITNFCDYILRIDMFGAEKMDVGVLNAFNQLCIKRNVECHIFSGKNESSEEINLEIPSEDIDVSDQFPEKRESFRCYCDLLTPVLIGHPNPGAFFEECARKLQHLTKDKSLEEVKESVEWNMEDTRRRYYYRLHHRDGSFYVDSLTILKNMSTDLGRWVKKTITNDMSKYRVTSKPLMYANLKIAFNCNPFMHDLYTKGKPLIQKLLSKELNMDEVIYEHGDEVSNKLVSFLQTFYNKCMECMIKKTLKYESGIHELYYVSVVNVFLYEWCITEIEYKEMVDIKRYILTEIAKLGIVFDPGDGGDIIVSIIDRVVKNIAFGLSDAIGKSIDRKRT